MQRHFSLCHLAGDLAVLALWLLPRGSQVSAAPKRPTPPTPQVVKPAAKLAVPPAQGSLAYLAPVNSGPGIVVCEPSSEGSSAEMTAFGTGCAHWLQMMVGGQAELGKTPFWSHIAVTQKTQHWPNMRLATPVALTLSHLLGVTHVATGQLSGTPEQSVLTYRLWQAPGGAEVGAPIVLQGSQTDLLAALPEAARQMARRLGVAQPRIPAEVGATPAEMIEVGQIPWGGDTRLTPEQQQHFNAQAGQFPLAGLALIDAGAATTENVTNLLAAAPDNPVLLGDIAWHQTALLEPFTAKIHALEQRFPDNYQLTGLEGIRQHRQGNFKSEQAARELAVRCAPHNPWAWQWLSDTLSAQSEALRRGRTVGDITEAEWVVLNKLYSLREAVMLRVTQLNSRNSEAWYDLATAATFNGEANVADAALWKALALDPTNADAYYWGLQMYQPKWYGDPVKLLKVARMAATRHFLNPTIAQDVIEALQDSTEMDEQIHKIVLQAFSAALDEDEHLLPSGPGILVCEPVAARSAATKADPATASFGIGCGRWLHFTLGSLPQCGKTPLWSDVDVARRNLKLPNLQLGVTSALAVAKTLGLPYVATGRIEGTPQQGKLVYRLYRITPDTGDAASVAAALIAAADNTPAKAPAIPVGEAFIAQGSAADITAHLPDIARQMAARLGVNAPADLSIAGAGADDLEALGKWPWTLNEMSPLSASALTEAIRQDQEKRLTALASHLPVAGMMALSWVGRPQLLTAEDASAATSQPARLHALAQQLLAQAPGNPLLLAQIGEVAPKELLPSGELIARAVAQSPHNYLLATTNSWLQGQQRQPKGKIKASWQAVRCSPGNFSAWLALSHTLNDVADATRQGRSYGELSATEVRYINTIYPLCQVSASEATLLAPASGQAWLELSSAASLNSDVMAADRAFRQGLTVDPTDPQIYAWGLQIYQPKWQDDPQGLWQVAQAAAADEARFTLLAPDILDALQAAKLQTAPAQRLAQKASDKLEALVRLNLPDASIQKKLGFFFWGRQQNEMARLAFESWVRLKPEDADAQYWLGALIYAMQQYDDAANHYREAIRLDPNSPALLQLGTFLVWKGQAAEAEPLLRHYLELHPVNTQARFYHGQALLALSKPTEARAELAWAVRLDQQRAQDGQVTLGELGKQAQDLLDSHPAPPVTP